MKKSIMIGLMALLMARDGMAAWERTRSGGRSGAMGGTSVTQNDFWSLNNNQAGTAWFKGISAGFSFGNEFLMKELMNEQIGVAIAFKAGTIGLLVNRFGNNQYCETNAGLSFARKFGKQFAVGIQMDYLGIKISDNYGNKNLLSCEIGLMYHADKHLSVGVQLINPVPVKIIVTPVERLPSTICIGISYSFSNEFLTTVEAEKDLENPLVMRAGAEYHLAAPVYARIGISANPISFSFGAGLEFGKINFDLASSYHQALGFSPSGSIIYSFK